MNSPSPSTDALDREHEALESLPPRTLHIPERYTEEQKHRICYLIAYYATYKTIVEVVQREFRRAFPFQHYVAFRRSSSWQPLIASLRQQYLANFDDVPIAQQRVRLERLEKLYQEAETVKLKTMVLRAASDELKEPSLKHQTNIAITAYYQMSASELEQKRREVLNRLRHLKAQEHAEGSAGGSDAIIEA